MSRTARNAHVAVFEAAVITVVVKHVEEQEPGEWYSGIGVAVQVKGTKMTQEIYLEDVHRYSRQAWDAALTGQQHKKLPLERNGEVFEIDGGFEGGYYCDHFVQRLSVTIPCEWLEAPLRAALDEAEAAGLPFASDPDAEETEPGASTDAVGQ